MNDEPLWVVIGLDKDGKPHGSKFGSDEAELAKKAAEALTYTLFEVTDPELRPVAESLAPGRLYGTGKAFAPFIKTDAYLALRKAAGAPSALPDPGAEDAGTEALELTVDQDLWQALGVGSRVIATAPGREGWWACDVVGVSDGGAMLTLRWTGFDEEPAFACPRTDVAVLHEFRNGAV